MRDCPICGSKLHYNIYSDEYGRTEESHEKCVNGCYSEDYAYGTTKILIFGEEFYEHYDFNKEQCFDVSNKIEDTIKYWKENDRYLTKILTIN
ncbi:MAG: hypothetical protein K0R18_489 [Bacillales bacterium]|nr:hypothetical protein [Bacillales bacterium]